MAKSIYKPSKFIYWTPRILSILFLLFLTLFSFDVIQPGLRLWQIALGFFMHNIPVLVLLAVLIISWKHEIVGGIVFILAGLFYITSLTITSIINGFEWYYIVWSLNIAGPALFIGILFLIGWFKKRKVYNTNIKLKKKEQITKKGEIE